MKVSCYYLTAIATLLLFLSVPDVQAQFVSQWLDIGEYHHAYVESGARDEVNSSAPQGMNWPAILRNSGHVRAKALWVGVRNWTDPNGTNWPHFVARIGPRTSGADVTFPVSNRIISKFDDTTVEVDGALSFDKVAIVDEIDSNLPADRMVHNIHNVIVGVTVERKAYAYANQNHDNYHIVEYTYTNTGNADDDEDIELPNQTLEGVYFFRIHRWRGSNQGAWAVSGGQVWGKFSMIDVVGDGHSDYPVNFTAQYLWIGVDPEVTQFDPIGGPLWNDNQWVAQGDSVGRLAATTFMGRAVIHADRSPTDPTYNRCTPAVDVTQEVFDCQPHTLGYMDQDEALTSDGSSHQDYYDLGILTRENPTRFTGGSAQMFPHYGDRVEPSGIFWEAKNDASTGKQGGHAPTTAYGPYTMAPGESVRIVVVEGVKGLGWDAEYKVGRAFKRGGGTRDTRLIQYDANGDGVITTGDFTYDILPQDTDGDGLIDTYGTGLEEMTKNQWSMVSRDSLFLTFERGINLYAASNNMTVYPIPEPPRPPRSFSVTGRPDKVELRWEAFGDGPQRIGWEIYRTDRFEDNLYGNGCQADLSIHCGYELIQTLDAGATSYDDTDLVRGTDYYYFIQAVGAAQPVDIDGLTGTPNGSPLRSGRYYAQTYQPVNLKRPAYGPTGTVRDARVVPNPVNLGSDESVRFAQEDRMAFFNIPGNCTIKIFSEIGELIHTIEHTDGSGDETWNLTTTSRQLLVSGIYIAVITDLDTGEEAIQKFTVIR